MAIQTQIADGATLSAPIPFPLPLRRCAQFRSVALQPIPRPGELIQALGNALAAVDLARRHSPSALGNVLDVMTEQARATYARVKP